MENKDEIKILADSMVEMGKMSTANSLEYLKYVFEAFKKLRIPKVSQDGQYCYGVIEPYRNTKELQYIVDFMITYLEGAIKQIDNKKEDEPNDK